MKHALEPKKRFAYIAFSFILAVSLGSLSCSRADYSRKTESITIGTTISEVNSLILIARAQSYFASNGLNVTHKIYPSGIAAIDGMLKGESHLATGSEFAFAGEVLTGENISTIGVINRSSVNYLVGRVDRGIKSIFDLKGKRIGVPLGSRPEFALDRFLYLRGINTSEVTLVNIPVNRSVDALVSGEVDAVAAWQPYINRIKERMGDGLIVWTSQEEQPSFTLVMSRSDWTAENPDLITRFLKSLIQAENYNTSHPEDAKAKVQGELNYDEAYMASVWPDYRFTVSLDQSLILAMEDQARWMISKNLTADKRVPNFLDYIHEDALKAIKPEAVKILR